MTSQALALQDAAILAGMPRKNKWNKKAFRVQTEVKRVKWHNPRTGESGTYSEYGNASLHTRAYRELSREQIMEIARGIARCGFNAHVYINEDGEEPYTDFWADTDYHYEGTVSVMTIANGTVYQEREQVGVDENMKAQAWKRANSR